MKRIILILAAISILTLPGWSQSKTSKSTPKQDTQGKTSETPAPPAEKLEPIFPQENPNIIYIEGEDAISTNFNREPTLNYGCSGKRTLQLNRSTGLQGGASFYADYVFFVEQDAEYELWYGGTPPGPKEDLYPSFTSPFRLIVDDKPPKDEYRENIVVVENYAPSYYWNLVGDIKLSKGQHKIRFEVREKRRYDNKYYFYLDSFFLVKKVNGKRVLGKPIPPFFPKNMENRSINFPFRSIDDYLIIIRDNPSDPRPLIELSLIYSLVSDYLNAIRYLNRALILSPDNLDILLLIAKNRIWKGDITEGLKKYRELLKKDPKRLDIWMEAGKVAAWTGRYKESIAFYKDGLKYFKDNLDLLVNLGLTYLWSNQSAEGNKSFRKAEEKAGKNLKLLKKLAKIFIINGYPEYAITLYNKAISINPADLESYLLLEDTYLALGKKDEVAKIDQLIRDTFKPSDRLSRYLDIYSEKQSLRDRVIAEYERKLKEQPDNLSLRMTLAQTYFWNGLREKAIEEYLNILATHAFLELKKMDKDSFPIMELIDKSYIYEDFFERVAKIIAEKQKDLKTKLSAYNLALKKYNSFQKKVAKAKEKGEALPQPEGEYPYDTLQNAEAALSDSFGELESILESISSLIDSFEAETKKIPSIAEKEKKEEKVFSNIEKATRWKWNKSEFLNEFTGDAERGLTLARYLVGRIYQIERNYKPAITNLDETVTGDPQNPIYNYALFQTKLWSSRGANAGEIVESSQYSLSDYVPYFFDLQQLTESMKESTLIENSIPVDVSQDELKKQLADINAKIAETKKKAAAARAAGEKFLRNLHSMLYKKLVRTFYRYEQNTYLIRNELGGFYLNEKRLEEAISQFKHVLAVEPNNLSAIYKIGTIYQWNRNWYRAMQYYKRVYDMDPLYENTSSLYNQLAKAHSPSVDFQTYYLADSSRIQWHGEASYKGWLTSILGLELNYSTDNIRIKRTYSPTSAPSNTYISHSSYQTNQVLAGIPIDLYFMNLKVTPRAGGTLLANELYYTDEENSLTPLNGRDNFGYYAVEPLFKVDSSLSLGKYIYISGSYFNGRFAETFDPARTPVYENSGEASISTSFSFLDYPVIRDSSLRTYGKVDILSDSNQIYTGVGELYMYLFKGGNPYTVVSLSGNLTYQDSLKEESFNYYTPIEVLIGGGNLTVSTWIGIGNGNVLGLSLRGYGGTFQEKILQPGEAKRRIKAEGEADINLTSGNGYYYIGGVVNGTYCYQAPSPDLINKWDYWSFYLKIGYTAKLPNLLAP